MVAEEPTEEEEMSASTFLAAVKSRLNEWGKEEQYHEFVAALSSDVDVKTVCRILRGHDDLLWVFRRKFAPKADLGAIKAEVADKSGPRSDSGSGPRPPPGPPASRGPRMAKEEISSSTPFTPSGSGPSARATTDSDSGPRPPSFPPGRGVKRELVKTEGSAAGVVPRPPKFAPNAKRATVTIGDESDEEDDVQDEASILAAVKKGRTECVAELAKLIFRRERTAHVGAHQRLAMVRYATQRSAVPRFPRELFILRGAPGVGKTEYAMQHLLDYAELGDEDELAARLTHVCSADDFFEKFTGEDASSYNFQVGKVEPYHRKNEMRVRLAMEAGIHPLYVDCTNLRLWEMRPYVDLAERLGYVPTVVEPQEISEKCDDVDFLADANDTTDRRQRGKVVTRGLLMACLKAFEPLHEDPSAEVDEFDADPLVRVREAERPDAPRLLEALHVPAPRAARLHAPSRAPGVVPHGNQGKGAPKGGGWAKGGGKQGGKQGPSSVVYNGW